MRQDCGVTCVFQEEGPTLEERLRTLLASAAQEGEEPWISQR